MIIGFDGKRIFHNRTGLGNYSRDTVRILADFFPEHKYQLYNPKPGKINRLEIANSMEEVFPRSFFWKKLSSLWRQKAIVKDLVADGVKVYHGLTNELPKGIDKTNIKTVVTIHDLIFIRFPELYKPIDRKIHFEKFKRAARVADVVIAISEQTKRDIVEFLKIPKEKIKVVYQGCHQAFKESYKIEEKQVVKDQFNLPDNFILNVGTIEKRKNGLLLLKAIEESNHSLVFIGKETAYAQELRTFIKENKMEDRVLFLKNVQMNELAMIYQMANLFVYPSIFEGFGIPIVEALYSKTPVISTEGGCFQEAGGPFSMYVSPTDAEDLKKKINYVLEEPKMADEMKQNGFKYVQQFNDEQIAKRLMNIYKELF